MWTKEEIEAAKLIEEELKAWLYSDGKENELVEKLKKASNGHKDEDEIDD
jgi:hypothetical protein